MNKNLRSIFASKRLQNRGRILIFSCLWLLGFLLGLYFITASGDSFLILVREAALNKPSLSGLLFVMYFPLIVSFTAIYFSSPGIIYFWALIKSFLFSSCLCGIVAAFGSSGWLVRSLLLFSNSAVTVGILLFWRRTLTHTYRKAMKELLIFAVVFTAIGFIDYFLVSPYLAILMNHL